MTAAQDLRPGDAHSHTALSYYFHYHFLFISAALWIVVHNRVMDRSGYGQNTHRFARPSLYRLRPQPSEAIKLASVFTSAFCIIDCNLFLYYWCCFLRPIPQAQRTAHRDHPDMTEAQDLRPGDAHSTVLSYYFLHPHHFCCPNM